MTSFSKNDILWAYFTGLFEASFCYLFFVSDLINTLDSQYLCSFKRLITCCLNIFPFKIHLRDPLDSVFNKCMIKVAVSILSSYVMGKRSVLATLIHYQRIGLFRFSNNFFAITSDKWFLPSWEDALEPFLEIANLTIIPRGFQL